MANVIRLGEGGIKRNQMTFIGSGDTCGNSPSEITYQYSDIFDSFNLPVEWCLDCGGVSSTSSTAFNAEIYLQVLDESDGTWKNVAGRIANNTDATVYFKNTGVRAKSDTTDMFLPAISDNGNDFSSDNRMRTINNAYYAQRRSSVTINGTTYTRVIYDLSYYNTGRYYRFRYYSRTNSGTPVEKLYGVGVIGISPIAAAMLDESITSLSQIVVPMRQK